MSIDATPFPSEKGTYILILHLDTDTRLTIGKRGTFDFPAGFYAYVGSAFGSGGLRGRLKHHLNSVTKPHWHIDYLRACATVQAVWYLADDTRYEHQWAQLLITSPDAVIPVSRFGSSDCHCESHLIYFINEPNFDEFHDRFNQSSEHHITLIQQIIPSQ